MKTAGGFTLLELLLVILITGIIAVVVAPIIQEPIRSYFDQASRAALVDSADAALRRIARDARRALPYSVRTNAASDAVEFIRVRDGARYRPWSAGGPAAKRLRTGKADDSFNLYGTFGSLGARPYTLGTDSAHERLVIFNLGTAGFDSYAGDPVITPAGTSVTVSTDGNEDNVTMNPEHQFDADSPASRVYIADGGVSYACSGDGLFRWSGYGYQAAQPTIADVAVNGSMITHNVSACQFDYLPGNAARPELLIMSLTLTRNGESVTLLHQIHIYNAT